MTKALRIDVVSIFPQMFDAVSAYGICGRAIERGALTLEISNPRDFVDNAYGAVDDRPFGGGPGMVMQAQPLAASIEAIRTAGNAGPVVYMSPQGERLDQRKLNALAQMDAFTLVCGRYEGVDERFIERYVDEELSVGDFVISGGELAAMTIVDGVSRLLPEAVGCAQSVVEDSFYNGLLDHPHYTRPADWAGQMVPEALLSGDHERIRRWRLGEALLRTMRRRPDLLEAVELSDEARAILADIRKAQTTGD